MPENFDVAAGVVTNIFTDNPDAPIDLAVELGIPDRLVEGLVKDHLLDAESPISEAICFLLVNIIEVFYKTTTEELSPHFIHSMLLMPTLSWDDELHDEIRAAVVNLLGNSSVQSQIAVSHSSLLAEAGKGISEEQLVIRCREESPLMAFITLYEREESKLIPMAPDDNDENESTEFNENQAAVRQFLHALQNAAGDIASSLAYRNPKEMKRDPVVQYFEDVTRERYILSGSLESCLAFLCLGNIARNAKTCVDLVQNFDFHECAISLIGAVGKEHPEARHLAVGFLCNLANAAEQHKAIICGSKVIHQLVDPTWPEGLNDGLRLLRAVIRKSPQHCRWLLSPPTESPGCLVRMSDLEEWLPTMTPSNSIEVARLIVTLLRTLQLDENCADLTPDTFMTQNFSNCLLTLTEQGTRSPLASEGLLGFGLACKTPTSAQLVHDTLRAGFPRFMKAVGDGTEDVARENLENALVVLSKIPDEEAKNATRDLIARIESK
jgi:hypothetical protein